MSVAGTHSQARLHLLSPTLLQETPNCKLGLHPFVAKFNQSYVPKTLGPVLPHLLKIVTNFSLLTARSKNDWEWLSSPFQSGPSPHSPGHFLPHFPVGWSTAVTPEDTLTFTLAGLCSCFPFYSEHPLPRLHLSKSYIFFAGSPLG